MPGPAFGDDDWDELARELNVQKAPPADHQPHTPDLHPDADDAPVADVGVPDHETEAPTDEEFELEGTEGAAAEGEPGEGQPGTGRKRRRRRRRRKKGGPGEGAAGDTAEAAPAAEEPEEPVASYRGSVRVAVPARPEPEEAGFEEEPAEVGEQTGGVPLAAEEDTGGEMLRDLIASWTVPSWDEIVGGLYRPER